MQLLDKLTEFGGNVVASVKENSPTICLFGGIALGVLATVTACKATLKAQDVIDEFKDNMDKIHEADEKVQELAKENPEIREEKYSEEDVKKDIRNEYIKLGVKMVKTYLPSLIIGGFAIAGILTSNKIMRERNVALSAAYSGLKLAYDKYRARVVERYGEEVDRELLHGVKKKEVEEKVTDENGNTTTVKKEVDVVEDYGNNYTLCFNDSVNYKADNDLDTWFIQCRENWFRNKYNLSGVPYVTMQEVLEGLGFYTPENLKNPKYQELFKQAMVIGWKKHKNDPDNGDIIFRITRSYRRRADGEYEPALFVELNVDGNIYSDYNHLVEEAV